MWCSTAHAGKIGKFLFQNICNDVFALQFGILAVNLCVIIIFLFFLFGFAGVSLCL